MVRPVNEAPPKYKAFMACVVVILVTFLIILGVAEYCSSPLERKSLLQDLLARPTGTMMFRFILQPTMAALAAFRDGMRDARLGRAPYLWTVFTSKEERRGRLYEGLLSTASIILLGLIMDTIYQFIVLKTFYGGQAVIIALLLAFLPYVLLRGPIARIIRLWRGNAPITDESKPTRDRDA